MILQSSRFVGMKWYKCLNTKTRPSWASVLWVFQFGAEAEKVKSFQPLQSCLGAERAVVCLGQHLQTSCAGCVAQGCCRFDQGRLRDVRHCPGACAVFQPFLQCSGCAAGFVHSKIPLRGSLQTQHVLWQRGNCQADPGYQAVFSLRGCW